MTALKMTWILTFIHIAPTILKWRTFKLLRWVQWNSLTTFCRLVHLDNILYVGDYMKDNLDHSNGSRLNFWGGCNSWTVWWIWMKFCMNVITLKVAWCHIFNPVASTIPQWPKIKLLKWVKLLKRLVNLGIILYWDDDIEGKLEAMHQSHIFNNSKTLD
jgi:hypothetical protein